MKLPIQPAAIRRDFGRGLLFLSHTVGPAVVPADSPLSGPCNPKTEITCNGGCCIFGSQCLDGQCTGDP